jgi:hypothetical protein
MGKITFRPNDIKLARLWRFPVCFLSEVIFSKICIERGHCYKQSSAWFAQELISPKRTAVVYVENGKSL